MKTPNKEAAVKRAAKFYNRIVTDGWEAALEKFKLNPPPKVATTVCKVLRSPVAPRLNVRGSYHYRANKTFNALRDWLRDHGVTVERTANELRKESGSLVCATHGIHAASTFLRHSDIALTAAHYIDSKKRVTVGFSALAAATAPNVIEFTTAETPKTKRKQA